MTLHPDTTRRLFHIAGELATELRCQLHACEAAEANHHEAETILARYDHLVRGIEIQTGAPEQ